MRIWDGDDGMVHMRGEFDPVTGKRIANRLRTEARRLHDIAKKQTADSNRDKRLTFDQCMADALDNLTSAANGGGKPFADICVVAHVDDATGELIAELPDGERLPKAVLEQLSCNAKLTGVVYDRTGKPIWRTESRRTVTESQWQLLIAKWGGCFHCGRQPRHLPGTSHRAGLTRRTHQARQPCPGLLELPPPHPPPQLVDPQEPRRQPHPPPARPGELRTRPRPRLPAARVRIGHQQAQPRRAYTTDA